MLDSFRSLVKALRIADRASVRAHGLGSAQIFVLHQLRDHSPLSINQLAALTSTDQSSVSVVVDKLARRGYLQRVRSQEDARRVEVTLTPKGRRLLRALPPAFQQVFRDALSGLSPARVRTLANTLSDLVAAIGAHDEHPPMFFQDS